MCIESVYVECWKRLSKPSCKYLHLDKRIIAWFQAHTVEDRYKLVQEFQAVQNADESFCNKSKYQDIIQKVMYESLLFQNTFFEFANVFKYMRALREDFGLRMHQIVSVEYFKEEKRVDVQDSLTVIMHIFLVVAEAADQYDKKLNKINVIQEFLVQLAHFLIECTNAWEQEMKESNKHHKSCNYCYLESEYKCKRCRRTYYCSKEHQQQDWASHKTYCM